jgi:hypothetical protein
MSIWLAIFLFVSISIVVFIAALKIFPHTVTLQEVGVGVLIQGLVIGLLYFGGMQMQGADVQIFNGAVLSKSREIVPCSHSYRCNCHTTCTGTGTNRSCSESCSTCYEHTNDYDWDVQSSVGDITIDRVDRRGSDEPPRWTAVVVGEPFAKEDSYFNYIKASPLSIFNKELYNSTLAVPSYPLVYDYYRINRVINHGSKYTTDLSLLNQLLNDSLKQLGPKKKANLVVIFHNQDTAFVETTKAKHLGGKINDVYVMIKADETGIIEKVDSFSWAAQDIINVQMRDAILDLKTVDIPALSATIATVLDKHYVRRDIEDFAYLEDSIELPFWIVLCIGMFGFAFPIVWSYAAHKHIN